MKVLVAENNALFREALSTKISQIFPHAILLYAGDFTEYLNLLHKEKPFDLIIIDFDMPEMSSEYSLNAIISTAQNNKIVVVSESGDNAKIRKLFALGIQGYILKNSNSKIIGNILQLVLNGGKYLPEALLDISTGNTGNHQATGLLKPLTNRQSQVLDLVAQGKSNKQIAYDMGVSEATVKLHINALLRSLHVTNRTQAVITAQKIGLI